jgi:hypothetical protein
MMERERPIERVVSVVARTTEAQRHEILVPVANPATTLPVTWPYS